MPYSVPEELNHRNGDIILRSSDAEEFRVFRWPLQHLYPGFSDMFDLPNPAVAPPQDPPSPPVLQMNETAVVIEALLRLSHPVAPPTVKDSYTMTAVTEALIKLRAEQRCRWWIRTTAEHLIRENPWAMYAIFLVFGRKNCDYNFNPEVRFAARGTVGRPVIRPWKEARLITAADYERLLVYHSECKNSFLKTQKEMWGKVGRNWPWFDCACPSSRADICVEGFWVNVAPWFLDFRLRAVEALSNGLRGEVIEDVGLWHDPLDTAREAGKLCTPCKKSSALRMPAYVKEIAKLSEEAFSQVSRSSGWLGCAECSYLLVRRYLPLNGELPGLPLNHFSPWRASVLFFSLPCSSPYTVQL